MAELNYSDYVDCSESNDFLASLDLSNVRNTYDLLYELIKLFKVKDIAKHKVFFSQQKQNGIDLCDFNNFSKLNENSQLLEVVLNENLYNQIDKDESIIQILERLTENFILLMKSLSYWDERLNFTNHINLSFAINNLCSSYKITYNYLKEERVDFLRQEYAFTFNTFRIIDSLLKVLENRINVMIKKISKFTGIEEEIKKLTKIFNSKTDVQNYTYELTSDDFIYQLVNTIDLYDNLK